MRMEITEVVKAMVTEPPPGNYLGDKKMVEQTVRDLEHQGFKVITQGGAGVFLDSYILERGGGR